MPKNTNTGWGKEELKKYANHNVIYSRNKRHYNAIMDSATNIETDKKMSKKQSNKIWEENSWKRKHNKTYEFM